MISRANHGVSNKKVIVLSLLFILCINIFFTETAFSDLINPKKTNPPTPIYPPTEPITPPENPTPNPIYPPPNPTPNPTPAPEPNSCQPGSSETYQCVDNKVQQLYDRNCPTEHWVTIKDCNQCGDPPCQCVGGVCVHMPGPNSSVNPKECDQQACQAQNLKIGVPYTKDGNTYQKYKDCNCKDGECQCESVDKEVPSECQDIKFQGEVLEVGSNGFDPSCHGTKTMMDYPYYVIKITNLISGPQPNGDTIRLQVNPYWKSEDDCSINPKGSYDKGIAKGDTVEVLGCYEADGPRVSISEKDYYYIKKLTKPRIKLLQTPIEQRPKTIIAGITIGNNLAIDVTPVPSEGSAPLTVDMQIKNNKAVIYEIWTENPDGTTTGSKNCPQTASQIADIDKQLSDLSSCSDCRFISPNTWGLNNPLYKKDLINLNPDPTHIINGPSYPVTFDYPQNNHMWIHVSRDTWRARYANVLDAIFYGAFSKHIPLDMDAIETLLGIMGGEKGEIALALKSGDMYSLVQATGKFLSDMGNCEKVVMFLSENGLIDLDKGVALDQLSQVAALAPRLLSISSTLIDTYGAAPMEDTVLVWAEPVESEQKLGIQSCSSNDSIFHN